MANPSLGECIVVVKPVIDQEALAALAAQVEAEIRAAVERAHAAAPPVSPV